MSSQLYIGNGSAAPAVIVEKQVSNPLYIPRIVDENGVYGAPINEDIHITTGNATSIGDGALESACYYMNTRTYGGFTVEFPEVIEVTTTAACQKMMQGHGWIAQKTGTFSAPKLQTVSGTYAFYYAFWSCKNLISIDLSSLTTLSGLYCMAEAFRYTGITTLDLHNLKTVSGTNALQTAFGGTSKLVSVDLSGLESITGNSACLNMFRNDASSSNKLKNITFDSLQNISGNGALNSAFYGRNGLENIYFPALKTTSFGNSKNQFASMVGGVTGCAIHFPSNLEPTIQTLTGYPNFGGTETVLLYDLPATE